MKQEYHRLKFKEETISEKKKALILRALKENNGRITFEKEEEDDDYPPAAILYGRKDTCFISVTDVYTDEKDNILVDGMDDDSGNYKSGFRIEPEQYSDILYFIGYALGWNGNTHYSQSVKDTVNSTIMEMACQLAEKEMVDGYGKLPEYFADNNGEYTEFYRDIFNPLYDKYYNRLAELADFEIQPA
jgi:hypothetical protein